MRFVYSYFIILIFILSCAGTHGFIQRYKFNTTKSVLETTIQLVLSSNPTFLQQDQVAKLNDPQGYMTIFIKSDGNKYGFRIRYYGDEKYWSTSNTTEIFIASARINGVGGKNDDESMTEELKYKLSKVFEERFINLVKQRLLSQPK
jgi:hypothetical protein